MPNGARLNRSRIRNLGLLIVVVEVRGGGTGLIGTGVDLLRADLAGRRGRSVTVFLFLVTIILFRRASSLKHPRKSRIGNFVICICLSLPILDLTSALTTLRRLTKG